MNCLAAGMDSELLDPAQEPIRSPRFLRFVRSSRCCRLHRYRLLRRWSIHRKAFRQRDIAVAPECAWQVEVPGCPTEARD